MPHPKNPFYSLKSVNRDQAPSPMLSDTHTFQCVVDVQRFVIARLPTLAALALVNTCCYKAVATHVQQLPTIVAFEMNDVYGPSRVCRLNLLSGEWHQFATTPIDDQNWSRHQDMARHGAEHNYLRKLPSNFDHWRSLTGFDCRKECRLFDSRAAFCNGQICLVRTRYSVQNSEWPEAVIDTTL